MISCEELMTVTTGTIRGITFMLDKMSLNTMEGVLYNSVGIVIAGLKC